MQKIIEIVFRQFATIYVGNTLLYIYYKITGKNISYEDILNKKNENTGYKKYTYISFIAGFIFILLLILLTKKMFRN